MAKENALMIGIICVWIGVLCVAYALRSTGAGRWHQVDYIVKEHPIEIEIPIYEVTIKRGEIVESRALYLNAEGPDRTFTGNDGFTLTQRLVGHRTVNQPIKGVELIEWLQVPK